MNRSNFWISKLKNLLIAYSMGFLLLGFIWLISQFENPPGINLFILVWLGLTGFIMWETAAYIIGLYAADKAWITWSLSVAAATIAYAILFAFMKYLDHTYYYSEPLTPFHLIVSIVTGLILALIMVGVQQVARYRQKWKHSVLEREKMKKEQAIFQLKALQSQTNPHFLFNNLNTLYGLILDQSPLAAGFLEKLTDLYQYILQNKDEQVVPAHQEWDIALSYLDLLKKRFGTAIKLTRELDKKELAGFYLPPLSLQELIENALKHNRADESHPLCLSLKKEGTCLKVSNTLAPKIHNKESHGFGLQNLKHRLQFLTDVPLKTTKENGTFIVYLPLLSLDL